VRQTVDATADGSGTQTAVQKVEQRARPREKQKAERSAAATEHQKVVRMVEKRVCLWAGMSAE
jgi:hypothetical protein